jgi:hypothetical protein
MRIGRTVVPLLVVLIAAACTREVDGTVRPARGLTPRPLSGLAIQQVLLDDSELSKIINQPFKGRAELPSRLVEVNVAYFIDHHPDGAAVDIAHGMMDKVSSLS